jgi:hypothetical protein
MQLPIPRDPIQKAFRAIAIDPFPFLFRFCPPKPCAIGSGFRRTIGACLRLARLIEVDRLRHGPNLPDRIDHIKPQVTPEA